MARKSRVQLSTCVGPSGKAAGTGDRRGCSPGGQRDGEAGGLVTLASFMHSKCPPLSPPHRGWDSGAGAKPRRDKLRHATRDPTGGPAEYRQLSSAFQVFRQNEPCPPPPKSQKDVYEDSASPGYLAPDYSARLQLTVNRKKRGFCCSEL